VKKGFKFKVQFASNWSVAFWSLDPCLKWPSRILFIYAFQHKHTCFDFQTCIISSPHWYCVGLDAVWHVGGLHLCNQASIFQIIRLELYFLIVQVLLSTRKWQYIVLLLWCSTGQQFHADLQFHTHILFTSLNVQHENSFKYFIFLFVLQS